METWLPIPQYEGKYEVSDSGRIRSLARGIMTPKKRGAMHLAVELYKDGVGRFFSIHVLVLSAFVSQRPEGLIGCHNNGISTDNRLENLRWDTYKSNTRDMWKHGTVRTRNNGNYKARLTASDIENILRDNRVSRIVAKDYGVCSSLIRNIRCGIAK